MENLNPAFLAHTDESACINYPAYEIGRGVAW